MSNISGPFDVVSANPGSEPCGTAVRRRPAPASSTLDTLVPATKAPRGPVSVAATRTPLAASDLMWARLPGPDPTPAGVLSFSGHVPRASAVNFLHKLFAVPAFARRLVQDERGRHAWENVSRIDVARHLHHHTLDVASDSRDFSAAFAQWCQAPLRPGQPPWDMTLVDCTDRSLIFVRVHHAITDGPGMMQALMSCHDDPGAWPRAERHAERMMARHMPQVSRLDPHATALQRLLHMGRAYAGAAARGAGAALECARSAWAIAVRSPDRRTCIKSHVPAGRFSHARVPAAWPIDTLKEIARAHGGGTVNDVVVTALTGALRDVLAQHGEPVDTLTLRAMQTVNMPRQPGLGINAGSNNVGLAMSDLPIGMQDPHARFTSVRAIMRRFKRSAEPWVAARAMAWVARLPQVVLDFMHRRTTGQCSVLISNVMGPIEPFVLDGHAAESMFWSAPRFGDVGVEFPVMSYAGMVQAAVQVDHALELDPAHIAERVQAHYEALRRAA